MRELAEDLRYGLRSFFRSPVSTAVALIALALGIGANSAIFNVINAVLIRPLPYKDASNLFVVWTNQLSKGMRKQYVSPLDYRDFLERNTVFDRIGPFRVQPSVLTGHELPERVETASASPGLFQVLGASAMY